MAEIIRRPPRAARWLIRAFMAYQRKYSFSGDLEEVFQNICEEKGYTRASLWYWIQGLGAIPAYLSLMIRWSKDMFFNYLKVAFRNLKKHKAYSFITIAGYAVGMCACILIFLWVRNELSYDRFHEKAARIFRVTDEREESGSFSRGAVTSAVLAPALQERYPEIVAAVRLYKEDRATVRFEGVSFIENRFFFADASFFNVFTFPILRGDPGTALRDSNTVVITEATAQKYFGTSDPMGKVISLQNRRDFKVTGVLKDIPANSHIAFDFLASYATFPGIDNPWTFQGWTYVLLSDPPNPLSLERKFDADREILGWYVKKLKFRLQAIISIHLHSHLAGEIGENGNVQTIFIFSIVAFLVILIAGVNFINLSVALFSSRAREVGLRKVIGAAKRHLIRQFLGESLLFSTLAFVAALVLASIFLPFFGTLIGKSFTLSDILDLKTLFPLLGTAVFIGIASGCYPAVVISSFRPVDMLRQSLNKAASPRALRKILVVGQFAVSVVLMILTGIVGLQLKFVRHKDLGFRKEQVVEIPLSNTVLRQNSAFFKEEFRKLPGVLSVSAAMGSPLTGKFITAEKSGSEDIDLQFIPSDEDYIETLGLFLVAGRGFSKSFPADAADSVIVNQTTVRVFDLKNPIGKPFKTMTKKGTGTIIGVIKDFHTSSLREPIKPTVLLMMPVFYRSILLRIAPDRMPATIAGIAGKWKEFAPGQPFEYRFVDEAFGSLYEAEEKLSRIFLMFSCLAALIACLGLFGLASFSTARRVKEIGIRKVLGAAGTEIVVMLSREFLKLVLLANVIAWPVAFLAAKKWLRNFSYRTGIGPEVFFICGLMALIIGVLAVITQAVNAARTNPATTLKYE